MNKLLLILFFLPLTSIGQKGFVESYLINNKGERQRIYLKEKEEVINLKNQISYYSSPNDVSIVIEPQDIREIGYVSNELVIKSTALNKINNGNPIWIRKLVHGANSLYYSSAHNLFIVEFDNILTPLYRTDKTAPPNSFLYKEQLYNSYNPNDLEILDFVEIDYSKNSLIEYFLENNLSNTATQKLKQEKQGKRFNLAINSGYVSHSIKPISSDLTNKDINSSGYKIGIKAYYNVDPLKGQLHLFAGINYYSNVSGSSSAVSFAGSSLSRDFINSLDFGYQSIDLGLIYNMHKFENFTIAPHLSFELTSLSSNNSFKVIDSDDQVVFTTDDIDNPVIINLGLNITYKDKLSFTANYGKIFNFVAGEELRDYQFNGNRLTLGLEYNIY
ncbi:hypothetical protein [Nonlabens ulvanivorans]|uniref:hypothetical protein n=1 Tax=Nonlabens ulvanivorans TaxID=906888 RepID=UPI0037C6ED09